MKPPSLDQFREFIAYVSHWYTEVWPEIFGDSPPLETEIKSATAALIANYKLADSIHPLGPQRELKWDGCSHDREIVRDIILKRRGEPQVEHGRVVDLIVEAMNRAEG